MRKIFLCLLLLVIADERCRAIVPDALLRKYTAACETPSDINEHVSTLRSLAEECSSVVECGLRGMNSTWGIIAGLAESAKPDRSYTGVDIALPDGSLLKEVQAVARMADIDTRFIEANDLAIDPIDTDMLFIDTWHTYDQLIAELEHFSPSVRKYIAMHDTSAPWGNRDEPSYENHKITRHKKVGKQGLWPAVEDFLARHPEWRLKRRYLNNHGLTILQRVENRNENKNIKALVLIISSDNEPVYKGLQQNWRSYMHSDPEHFECYFIQSDPVLSSDILVKEGTIWSKTQECIAPGIMNKTLLSLDAMKERLHEFDYVVRTNLSSFMVFPRLLTFLNNAPRDSFYCGIRHSALQPPAGQPSEWVCGAGILMSTDLAKMLIDEKTKLFDSSMIDDLVIAKFFNRNGVVISDGLYREIYTNEDWQRVRKEMPENVYHFRVKTQDRLGLDLSIHNTLLAWFYPNSGQGSLGSVGR